MILLYHETTTNGTITTPGNAAGVPWRPRHYVMEGHFLAVDGGGDPLVAFHDAEDICKIDGYRMATAAEQNEYRKMHEQQGALEESEQDHSSEEEAPHPEPLKEATPPRPQRRKGRG